jgi:Cu/Ag efflux protein CusF
MQFQSLLRFLGMIMWREHTARIWQAAMDASAALMGPVRNIGYWALERRHSLMWRVSFIVSLVTFAGCSAAYTPPPLTTQHPAHPEATATPELPPSNTLAYRPSDVPLPRPATSVAQRGTPGASPSAQQSPQTVVGEGKVIAVVPASSEIVVAHGEIKGFMDAMTMGYQIEPPSLLEEVQAGDAVRFTIDTQQKAIVKIEKLQR